MGAGTWQERDSGRGLSGSIKMLNVFSRGCAMLALGAFILGGAAWDWTQAQNVSTHLLSFPWHSTNLLMSKPSGSLRSLSPFLKVVIKCTSHSVYSFNHRKGTVQ